jgi:hypothetical protein
MLREAHKELKLRVFENRVHGRVFGPKRGKKQKAGESYTVRCFVICIIQNTVRMRKSRRMK